MHNGCEKDSTTFPVMVPAPLQHNAYPSHDIIGEPLTSRHDSERNHHMMVLVGTSGLALRGLSLDAR